MTEARDNTYQDQMDDMFVKEYGDVLMGDKTLESFLDDWGYSKEELDSYLDSRPDLMDKLPRDFDLPNANVDNFSGINPEWEGEGITSEMLPGDSAVADAVTWLAEKAGVSPEAAMLAAGVVSRNPKNIKKGAEGMFNKGSKSFDKRKKFGDNTKQKKIEQIKDQRKGSNELAKTKQKQLDKNKRTAEKAGAAALTTGLTANRMLNGDRDVDGTLKVAPKIDLNAIARGDDSVGEEESGAWDNNQFGYHKRPGQNFWTIDNSDPYWDTHEMGTGSAFEDSALKAAPRKGLDWSSWF